MAPEAFKQKPLGFPFKKKKAASSSYSPFVSASSKPPKPTSTTSRKSSSSHPSLPPKNQASDAEDSEVEVISSSPKESPQPSSRKNEPSTSISKTINDWSKSKRNLGDASTRKMIQDLAKIPGVTLPSLSSTPSNPELINLAVKETNDGLKRSGHGSSQHGAPSGKLKPKKETLAQNGKGKQRAKVKRFTLITTCIF